MQKAIAPLTLGLLVAMSHTLGAKTRHFAKPPASYRSSKAPHVPSSSLRKTPPSGLGKLQAKKADEFSWKLVRRVALIVGFGHLALSIPIFGYLSIVQQNRGLLGGILSLFTLPTMWPIVILESLGMDAAYDPRLILPIILALIVSNVILGICLGYVAEKIRIKRVKAQAEARSKKQEKQQDSKAVLLSRYQKLQQKKHKQKEAARKARFTKVVYAAVLLIGMYYGRLLLFDPTWSYGYSQKYRKGEALIREKVDNAINRQRKGDAPIHNSPITKKKRGEGEAAQFNQSKQCLACYTSKDNTLQTTHGGLRSVCEDCVKKKYVQDFLSQISKVDQGYDNVVMRKPFDLNDATFMGKATDNPAYMTAEDMQAMGATKEQINAYVKLSHGNLFPPIPTDECVLCNDKNHLGETCPHKETLIQALVVLYVKHTGYGLITGFERILRLLAKGPYSKAVFQVTVEKDRPCPYCGIVTSKDEACNHVTCDACKKQFNWTRGKTNATSYEAYRTYKLDPHLLPYNGFNPNNF